MVRRDVTAAEAVFEGLWHHCAEKGCIVEQHQYNHDTFALHRALAYSFDLFPQGGFDWTIARRIPIGSDALVCRSLGHADPLPSFPHITTSTMHDPFQLDWILKTAWVNLARQDPSA